jgi:hypothetical protein
MLLQDTVPLGAPESPTTIAANDPQDEKEEVDSRQGHFSQNNLTDVFNPAEYGDEDKDKAADPDDGNEGPEVYPENISDISNPNIDSELNERQKRSLGTSNPSLVDTDDATEVSKGFHPLNAHSCGQDAADTDDDIEWDMADSELDEAVQRALVNSDSMSQTSRMEQDDAEVSVDDNYDEIDNADDASVVSNAISMNSVKSAVQLRLESRIKSFALTKESLQVKLDAAEQRKLYFMQGVAAKRHQRLEKAASARYFVDRREGYLVSALKKSMDEKLSSAAQRKEHFLQSKTSQLKAKNNKAFSARRFLEQDHEKVTKAIHEKLEAKMQKAALKKENGVVKFSEKMQAKMTKILGTKNATQSTIEKLEKKFIEKMDAAKDRKDVLDTKSKVKVEEHNQKRQERTDLLMKANVINVSTKRVELDSKNSCAAKRKQALLVDKKTKAAAYLALAYQRGQEAMKRKESLSASELQSLGKIPTASLGSIKEDMEFDPSENLSEKLALQWLSDENFVSSTFSMNVSKSKAQLRLEQYTMAIPTKSHIQAKLESASSRRDSSISSTVKKADTQAKAERTFLRMQAYKLKIQELSDKFNDKMEATTQRKTEIMINTVRGQAVNTNTKVEKSKNKQSEKDAHVAALKKKLERKLLFALERKDNIIATRSSKASSNVSVSFRRGKNATKQKDLTMEKIRQKSERKLDGASSRREKLRDLEHQKKEVMMLRREMVKSVNANKKLESMQKDLEEKIMSAHERKHRFLAAKKAKAAEHYSSTYERGLEVLKDKLAQDSVTKTKVDQKLESAEKRRLAIAQGKQVKREKINLRRQTAMKLAKLRKSERAMIAGWEEESLSPVDENEDLTEVDLGMVNSQDNVSCANSYEEKRLEAKQQLVEEIRLANEVKYEEMKRLTREIRRPGIVQREISVSCQSLSTIDTNEVLSFDEGEGEDISICGLSTVREQENNAIDRKKDQAALALAELDIKLSEIQLMQAILLAEEASLSGKSEFQTSNKSVDDLNRVRINQDTLLKEYKSADRKNIIKNRARNFFSHTLKQAQVAQKNAGKTINELKTKIEKTDQERRKNSRPCSR